MRVIYHLYKFWEKPYTHLIAQTSLVCFGVLILHLNIVFLDRLLVMMPAALLFKLAGTAA